MRFDPNEPPRSRTPAPVPATRRSRVTNGKQLFVGFNNSNTLVGRRLCDLIAIHIADLGGPDNCSEAEKALVRRAAQLTLQLELLEQRWAGDGGAATDKSLNTYQKTTGALRRVLQTLGLKRRAKDITPDLRTYLKARSREQSG